MNFIHVDHHIIGGVPPLLMSWSFLQNLVRSGSYLWISGTEFGNWHVIPFRSLHILCFHFLLAFDLWPCRYPKIQQTKMLVTCQSFGDWFLFGLVWQYSSIQKNIIKVGSKPWILTCSCLITLSLPFYTDPDSKRELNFCNGYLSLLYFWTNRWTFFCSPISNLKSPTLFCKRNNVKKCSYCRINYSDLFRSNNLVVVKNIKL